jgi:NADH:ubiquinone oxidoreductase subunit D
MTRPTHKQPVDVIIIDNMLHMVYCHTALENLSDPIGWVSFINKTDRHDITEILLKVSLNTIKPTNKYI